MKTLKTQYLDQAVPQRSSHESRRDAPSATLVGTLGMVVLALVGTLAAASGSDPTTTTTVPTGVVQASDCLLVTPDPCYTPQQYRVAYGVQALLDRKIDGRGETVTVLVPVPRSNATAAPSRGNDQPPVASDIRQDLEADDSLFGLSAARIQVVTSLVGAVSPWQAGGEEVGDLEKVHEIAPAATLRVVLMPSDVLESPATATADMLSGLRLAVSHTDVASISWSLGEHYFTKAQVAEMHSILRGAAAHHVTVIASSGDKGAASVPRWCCNLVKEVSLPASDPLVLGVGGTTLTANRSTDAYIDETAWSVSLRGASDVAAASGGGFSHLDARPTYQKGVPGTSKTRGVPDVSADADVGTPLVFTNGANTWIISAFGTSASAPPWGGLMALADQYAHHDLGFVNPAIYRIGRSSSYHKAFHDVTSGNNSVTDGSETISGYQAAPGWDPVTGWGSPDAQVLVPLLARDTNRGKA